MRVGFYMKLVVLFTHPAASRTQIANKWRDKYSPGLQTIWVNNLAGDFTNIDYNLQSELSPEDAEIKHGMPPQTWWGCLRLYITADTALSGSVLRDRLDTIQEAVKTKARQQLEDDGATPLEWTVKKFADKNALLWEVV